jgi:hypothetical protein
VQAFPGKERKWQVSAKGGTRPIWSRDGKELFYIAADNRLMVVDVKSGARFEHGNPKPLFQTQLTPAPGGSMSRRTANVSCWSPPWNRLPIWR